MSRAKVLGDPESSPAASYARHLGRDAVENAALVGVLTGAR